MRLKLPFKFLYKNKSEPYHKPKRIFSLRLVVPFFFLISITPIWFFNDNNHINYLKSYFENSNFRISNFDSKIKLKEIHLIGRENIPKELIIKELGLSSQTSMFSINLKSLNEKLQSIKWVKSSVIERRLPDTIIIKLEEYKPFALLQVNDGHIIISSDGKGIVKDNGKFGYLPVINGNGSEKHASKMLDMLSSEPYLFHQVWAISFIGKRRWDVSLRSGIKIKLPEKNPSAAWTKLSEIDRSEAILSREFDVIDMRKSEHLILTPSSRYNPERST